MNGFLKCKHGHFYKEELEECPYCPGAKKTNQTDFVADDLDKTRVSSDTQFDFDPQKTAVLSTSKANDALDKTQLVSPNLNNSQVKSHTQQDLNRTVIGNLDASKSGSAIRPSSFTAANRKMVGWLVSYTIDPMGVDFKLYEGMNSIGRDYSNTIPLLNDTQISGKHMQILSKKGKFYLKDEMAVNGTFLNEEELEIDQIYPIKDGDKIQIGNTIFTFKSIE